MAKSDLENIEVPMFAYEFYWHDGIKGYELIGILPERRKKPERITEDSIMNWGKRILGSKAGVKNIFFVKVVLDKNENGIFWPNLYSSTSKDRKD